MSDAERIFEDDEPSLQSLDGTRAVDSETNEIEDANKTVWADRKMGLVETIWPEWQIDGVLGQGSYGKVYRITREELGHVYHAAAKVIKIPQDKSEISHLSSMGMSDDSIRTYFKEVVRGILDEIDAMESLKGARNVVTIEDYKLVEHEDDIGWTIWIRMELLEGLVDYQRIHGNPDVDEAVRIGLDLCTALKYCHERGIVHRDVKPENVFVSEFGDYKLGDFGIAKLLEDSGKSIYSRKGTLSYMAPEVVRSEKYSANADIYSLGIMLYRFLNDMRFPLVSQTTGLVTPKDISEALDRRLSGETLPPPSNADSKLAKIILKACKANPSERYATISEMESDLRSWQDGRHVRNDPPGPNGFIKPVVLAVSAVAIALLAFLGWKHINPSNKPSGTDDTSPALTAASGGATTKDGEGSKAVVSADADGRVTLIGTLSRKEGSVVEQGATKATVTYVLQLDQPTTFTLGQGGSTATSSQKEDVDAVQIGGRLSSSLYFPDEAPDIYDSHWERSVGSRIRIEGELRFEAEGQDSDADGVVLEDASFASSSYNPSVTPRNDPSQYTWEEFSKIADMIRAASEHADGSTTSAEELCKKYGLVDEGNQRRRITKSLSLSSGMTVECTLVDVDRHDEVLWGQDLYPAGLTFMCYSDSLTRRFDSQNGVSWSESELNEWLNTVLISEFPEELSNNIVLSCKHKGSANTLAAILSARGEGRYDYDWHGPDDYLWAPSISEMGGNVDWNWSAEQGNKAEYDKLLSSEGDWFTLFATEYGSWTDRTDSSGSAGFNTGMPHQAIAMGHSYWLRSFSPTTQRPLVVANDGEVGAASDANEERHVVFCFNLGVPRYADGYEKDGIRTYPEPRDSYIPEWETM